MQTNAEKVGLNDEEEKKRKKVGVEAVEVGEVMEVTK